MLCGPGERGHVFVVDGVDPPVKLLVPVMHQVPNIILSVKDKEHRQALDEELIERGGVAWQSRDGQDGDPDYYSRQGEE